MFWKALLLIFFFSKLSYGDVYGCAPGLSNTYNNEGFKAIFYPYQFGNAINYKKASYMETTYKKSQPLGTTYLTNPYLLTPTPAAGVNQASANMFGITDFPYTNFVMELTGYFLAPETGSYTFTINGLDDSVMVYFATDGAFSCCKSTVNTDNTQYSLFEYLQNSENQGSNTVTQVLAAGVYYPIRVVYANIESSGLLDFLITTPSGLALTDFYNYVYQISDSSNICQAKVVTETIAFTGSETQTSTFTPLNLQGTTTVFIESPLPRVTVSNGWTGTTTSTSFLFPTGSTGTVSVLVATPDPRVTTTEEWTGSDVVTTTIYPSEPVDSVSDTIIVLVETPYPTTTIPWTGSEETTITSTFTGVDSNGVSTTEIIVLVETAEIRTTTTEEWNGRELSTTTVYPSDLSAPITVIVETPYPTTTIPWTGSEETTITSTFTGVDSNGVSTTEIIVLVQTADPRKTITQPWTGSTTTATTIYPLGSEGTVSVIVNTPIPTVTRTVAWTGSVETTNTEPARNIYGTATVVVKSPDPRRTITEHWFKSTSSFSTIYPRGAQGTITIIAHEPIPTVTTTIPWTKTVDATHTETARDIHGTATVIIRIPEPRRTTTEPWIGSTTKTTTIYPRGPEGTISIIVNTPIPTSTITVPWTGTVDNTHTEFASDAYGTAIVIVETPEARITVSEPWAGSLTDTTTIYPSNSSDPIIIVIETPTITGSSYSLFSSYDSSNSEPSTSPSISNEFSIEPSSSQGSLTYSYNAMSFASSSTTSSFLSGNSQELSSNGDTTSSSTITSSSSSASSTTSGTTKNVNCYYNGEIIETVNLETGSCSFPLPDNVPAYFNFSSTHDYDIEFYYISFDGEKYYNDIVDGGRSISISAKDIYNAGLGYLFQVHSDETPVANSTELLRKRLNIGEVPSSVPSGFVDSLEATNGVEVRCVYYEVADTPVNLDCSISTNSESSAISTPSTSSVFTSSPLSDASVSSLSSASMGTPVNSVSTTSTGTLIATDTDISTVIVTVTSCSDNRCSLVPVETGLTTFTSDYTTYTTYCPLAESTNVSEDISKTVVTITSCSDDRCSIVSIETGIKIVTDDYTTYTTFCPLSGSTDSEEITTTSIEDYSPGATGSGVITTLPTSVIKGTILISNETPVQPTTPIPSASSISLSTNTIINSAENSVNSLCFKRSILIASLSGFFVFLL